MVANSDSSPDIGIGTASMIYPVLNELFPVTGTPGIEEANNLVKKFFLLDGIRSIIAVVSCLFLILSLIAYHKNIS